MMVEWQCVWMDCGVQCVVTHGTLGMPQLCADNSHMKDVRFSCKHGMKWNYSVSFTCQLYRKLHIIMLSKIQQYVISIYCHNTIQ